MLRGRIVEEVCGLDIAVEDLVGMAAVKRREQRTQINRNIWDGHVPEVAPEIAMAEIGQDGNNLVGVPKSGDEGAHGGAVSQVIEEVELVEDARGGRSYINLLDGDIATLATRGAIGVLLSADRWRCPLCCLNLIFPVVVVVVVELVLSLVDGREGSCGWSG